MKWTIPLKPAAGFFIDFLFPPSCLVCGAALPSAGACSEFFKGRICAGCNPFEDQTYLCHPTSSLSLTGDLTGNLACSRCCEPAVRELCRERLGEVLCLPCIATPVFPSTIRSLWWYRGAVESLIKSYKYSHRSMLSAFLGASLCELISAENVSARRWEIVLPVPSSPDALTKRGFSHTGFIAAVIARKLGIALDHRALLSSRKRAPQAELPVEDRAANCRAAFFAVRQRVEGKRVLVIDDVVTSGATVIAATEALRAANAPEIDVITLARSEHFQRNRLRAIMSSKTGRRSALVREPVRDSVRESVRGLT